ncbi:uncharacterized protein MYCFIDRAFT_172457 [Pseudocercospora fijiensis CIRAD86]|uniref:Uncharacterized protein n=1 Tax=Pseudocercospora fijiensis (strain CIRAD86) TaxID=383855 RepID=M3BC85_PSEFD|nr:uncharacterized protein MYCFIDRAFT_172457 [Pseudocercospora fijiensis CIRAD86]EME86763.1 hypothetical protein MYCFIDRAFT_172457 [Pseudocercospora fijiensis CIRAD86]
MKNHRTSLLWQLKLCGARTRSSTCTTFKIIHQSSPYRYRGFNEYKGTCFCVVPAMIARCGRLSLNPARDRGRFSTNAIKRFWTTQCSANSTFQRSSSESIATPQVRQGAAQSQDYSPAKNEKQRYSQDEDTIIILRKTEGSSTSSIAEELDRSKQSISQRIQTLSQYYPNLRKRGKGLTAAEQAEVHSIQRSIFDDGLSIAEVCQKIGRSGTYVRNRLRWGQRRTRPGRTAELEALVLAMKARGYKYESIAHNLEIEIDKVQNILAASSRLRQHTPKEDPPKGIRKQRKHYGWTSNEESKLLALYEQGQTAPSIARELNRHPVRTRIRLREMLISRGHLVPNGKLRYFQSTLEEVVNLREKSKLTWKQIAERFPENTLPTRNGSKENLDLVAYEGDLSHHTAWIHTHYVDCFRTSSYLAWLSAICSGLIISWLMIRNYLPTLCSQMCWVGRAEKWLTARSYRSCSSPITSVSPAKNHLKPSEHGGVVKLPPYVQNVGLKILNLYLTGPLFREVAMCIVPGVAWIKSEPYYGFRVSFGVDMNEVELSNTPISSNNLCRYTISSLNKRLGSFVYSPSGNVHLEQQAITTVAQFACPGARIVEAWTVGKSRELRFRNAVLTLSIFWFVGPAIVGISDWQVSTFPICRCSRRISFCAEVAFGVGDDEVEGDIVLLNIEYLHDIYKPSHSVPPFFILYRKNTLNIRNPILQVLRQAYESIRYYSIWPVQPVQALPGTCTLFIWRAAEGLSCNFGAVQSCRTSGAGSFESQDHGCFELIGNVCVHLEVHLAVHVK